MALLGTMQSAFLGLLAFNANTVITATVGQQFVA